MSVFKSNNQTGFTLIELLLYVAIVGSLLTAIVAFLMVSIDARVKNQSIAEVDQQGVFAMEQITKVIRNASSISSPAAGASGAALTVVVPNAGSSPTTFNINAGALQVTEGSGSAVPLTNSKVQMSDLTFTNLSRSGTNGIVRVSFALRRVNPTGRNEYDYQKTFVTSVGLR